MVVTGMLHIRVVQEQLPNAEASPHGGVYGGLT